MFGLIYVQDYNDKKIGDIETICPIPHTGFLKTTGICAEIPCEGIALQLASAVFDEKTGWSIIRDPIKVKAWEDQKTIKEMYEQMNEEILAQMKIVFGTTNPESASAYNETWKLMEQNPNFWASHNMKAQFDIGAFQVGDDLDDADLIEEYAHAKLIEVQDYAVWRMQRIEKFRQDKLNLV